MKKLITLLTILAFASFAQAGIILSDGVTDVGMVDTKNGEMTIEQMENSGEGSEIFWGNNIWNTSYTSADFIKDEEVSYEITNFEGEQYLAFELGNDPLHYIVKNSTFSGFFTNNALYNWAVIALDDLTGFNVGEDKLIISHVSSFGSAVSVPEPATFGLFALGLVGLSAARRRKAV